MTTHAASESTTDQPEIEQLASTVRLLEQDNARLREQLDWFRRQVFGQKSEKRVPGDAGAHSRVSRRRAAPSRREPGWPPFSKVG